MPNPLCFCCGEYPCACVGNISLYRGNALKLVPCFEKVTAIVTDPPAGISFIGMRWDSSHGGRNAWIARMADIARVCLKACKPGAYALVWALPRTSHWTATAWENGGWIVRDRIGYLFGSGFPKNYDISKGIDLKAGAEREVVGKSRRNPGGASWGPGRGAGDCVVPNITAPATPLAQTWDGWGTALKPAVEDWWLLQKPLDSSYVDNALAHDCGGLNIEGCRVPTDEKLTFCHDGEAGAIAIAPKGTGVKISTQRVGTWENNKGRWPAHLIHDGSEEVEEVFPKEIGFGDSGTASRFFYTAKAPKSERGEGNNHPTVKPLALMNYLCQLVSQPGRKGILLDPFAGSGSTLLAGANHFERVIGIEQSVAYCKIAEKRILVRNAMRGLL